MNNINRLITLWMGECWHEADPHNPDECLRCKSAFQDKDGEPYDCESANPDFSLPDHFARFTKRLFEQEKMWKEFRRHAFNAWLSEDEHHYDDTSALFETWLFSDPSRPRDLMAEWLQLPEVVERFGWVECPNCEQGYAIRKVGHRMEGTTDRCQFCDGTGKVLSEWAREVNNA